MRGTTSRAAARGPEAPREGQRFTARVGALLHGGLPPPCEVGGPLWVERGQCAWGRWARSWEEVDDRWLRV